MLYTRLSLILITLLFISGCSAHRQLETSSTPEVPLFQGMGHHSRPIATSVPLAQKYFDQGLVWTFAFNHDEAIRSFQKAAALDSKSPMPWWGIALCHGPHINNPLVTPENAKLAWQALTKAQELKANGTPVEQALIEALSKRYSDPPLENRQSLDKAYAAAMRKVWRQYPKDPDIGVLFAESLMDLRPWDLWTQQKQPQPGTKEIISVLNQVHALQTDHPGALHLSIHVLEASPHPEKAIVYADRLRTLVPAAGHLVHMPSHIDVLTSQWEKAVVANALAIEADRTYRQISPTQGFYHIYMAHNHHMQCFAAMMQGRSKLALKAAREMIAGVPQSYAETNAALIDGVVATPYEVLMRFGQWDALLAEPAPPKIFPITHALWRFSRGIAYAAQGKVQEAQTEKALFEKAVAAVPKDAMFMINPADKVLVIAEHVLTGEIAYRSGDHKAAFAALRQGVKAEDNLKYMEPPEWIQPVRQTLGALLLAEGQAKEAEKVYREDLKKWPDNGWSLYGLAKSLAAQDKIAEAETVKARFQKIWSQADITIGSSCMCVALER